MSSVTTSVEVCISTCTSARNIYWHFVDRLCDVMIGRPFSGRLAAVAADTKRADRFLHRRRDFKCCTESARRAVWRSFAAFRNLNIKKNARRTTAVSVVFRRQPVSLTVFSSPRTCRGCRRIGVAACLSHVVERDVADPVLIGTTARVETFDLERSIAFLERRCLPEVRSGAQIVTCCSWSSTSTDTYFSFVYRSVERVTFRRKKTFYTTIW